MVVIYTISLIGYFEKNYSLIYKLETFYGFWQFTYN